MIDQYLYIRLNKRQYIIYNAHYEGKLDHFPKDTFDPWYHDTKN